MVPRLSISSPRSMPTPLSAMASVPAALSGWIAIRKAGSSPRSSGVSSGEHAQLLAGVGGVGDQFAQEDVAVGIDGMHHQVQEARHLRLERAGLAFGAGLGHRRRELQDGGFASYRRLPRAFQAPALARKQIGRRGAPAEEYLGVFECAQMKVVRFGVRPRGAGGLRITEVVRRTGPSEATIERLLVQRGLARAERGRNKGIHGSAKSVNICEKCRGRRQAIDTD